MSPLLPGKTAAELGRLDIFISGVPHAKINLKEKLDLFSGHWSPRIAGEHNGQHVKLAKLKGEFVWHHHDNEDKLFLVMKGRLLIRLRTKNIELDEGEFMIIPRGVEHQPFAKDEVHVLLFEPMTTVNRGYTRKI